MEPESANRETPLDSDDGGPMNIAVMEGQTDRPHERPHGCDTSIDETSSTPAEASSVIPLILPMTDNYSITLGQS